MTGIRKIQSHKNTMTQRYSIVGAILSAPQSEANCWKKNGTMLSFMKLQLQEKTEEVVIENWYNEKF